MAKLEFIGNTFSYELEPGIVYIGIHSPFSIDRFKLIRVIPECNYQLCSRTDNGDIKSTTPSQCEECIKAGLNYRIEYQYIHGTIKARARHRFMRNINYKEQEATEIA